MSSSLIKKISEHFDLKELQAIQLIRSAPFRYKVFKIPKKRKGQLRTIAQPAKEVKIIQYWIIDNILKHLPVHRCASAYIKNKNIKDNANIHVKNKYILKMDFENFFPSIKPRDFIYYARDNNIYGLENDDIDYAVHILFWKPKDSGELELSIGAPSSPIISNILMFDFDKRTEEMCNNYDVSFTRYSDDLVFSTNNPNLLKKIYFNIKLIIKDLKSPIININEAKTIYSSKKHRRRVTGVILTNEGNVSLGREKKRHMRTMIYRFINGNLDREESLYLKGLLAFAYSIEPKYIEKMREKYGEEFISIIKYQ